MLRADSTQQYEMGFLDSPTVAHHCISQSKMLNIGQQMDEDSMPSDEEIKELFSKGKLLALITYCEPSLEIIKAN